jgi:hypothetical protein
MVSYSKILLRVAVFFALVTAAIVLSKPATVSAFQDCCQDCANKLAACLNGCTTLECRAECEFVQRFCIEDCPACE